MFVQFLFDGFASGCQTAIFSMGFWLAYATGRFMDVGHAGIFVLAGYIFVIVGYQMTGSPFWAAMLAVTAAWAAMSLFDVMLYRPLVRRGASGLVLLLTSIAVYEFVIHGLALAFGSQTRLVVLSANQNAWQFGNLRVSPSQTIQIGAAVILLSTWHWLARSTRAGLYVRASMEDNDLLDMCGINSARVRSWAAGVAAVLVGIAGCTAALDSGINPERGMPSFLDAVAATLLGGAGSIASPAVGAIALGLLKAIVAWRFSETWAAAVTFAALMCLLVWRPGGLRTMAARQA